ARRTGLSGLTVRILPAECRIRTEAFIVGVRGGRRWPPGQGSHGMTQYLISFDDGWMNFPAEELPDVAKAAQEVVHEARDAGVWVFGGGLESQRASVVATDGRVTDGPYPETKEVLGGVSVVDVSLLKE